METRKALIPALALNLLALLLGLADSRTVGAAQNRPDPKMAVLRLGKVHIRVMTEFVRLNNTLFCLDPTSGKYEQGTLYRYDDMADGGKSEFSVAHRMMGCEMKAAGVDRLDMEAINLLWEGFEILRGDWLDTYRRIQRSYPNLPDPARRAFNRYSRDTMRDLQDVRAGYLTNGRDCLRRFIPKACYTEYDLLQRIGTVGMRDDVIRLPNARLPDYAAPPLPQPAPAARPATRARQ